MLLPQRPWAAQGTGPWALLHPERLGFRETRPGAVGCCSLLCPTELRARHEEPLGATRSAPCSHGGLGLLGHCWGIGRVTGQKYGEAVPAVGGCATTLLRHLPGKEVHSHGQSALLGTPHPVVRQKVAERAEEQPWAYTSSRCKGRCRGEPGIADKSPVAPSNQGLGQAGVAGQQVSTAWTRPCPHGQALMGLPWEKNEVPRATLLFCPSPALFLSEQYLCFSEGLRVYWRGKPNSSYPSHAFPQDCGWPHESLLVPLAWGHLALCTARQVLGEQEEKDANQQDSAGQGWRVHVRHLRGQVQ